jgi:hypothetical protein
MEEPSLAKERNDTDDPRQTMSMTEQVEPKLHLAITARDAPSRLKLRNDIELPNCENCRIDTEAPKRAKLLSEMVEPRFAISMTDKENADPTPLKPSRDNEAPNRTNDLNDNDDPT